MFVTTVPDELPAPSNRVTRWLKGRIDKAHSSDEAMVYALTLGICELASGIITVFAGLAFSAWLGIKGGFHWLKKQ